MKSVYFNIKRGQLINKYSVKKAFDLKDGAYELKITKRSKRSLPQNAFFHAILPDIQKGLYDVGYREVKTPEDAKEIVKYLFLKRKVRNEETDEEIIIVKKTSELNKEEMSVFIDEVIQWAAEYLSITIYSPNEQSRFQYE